jgi:threonine-phosphate decarboxylase
LTNGLSIGELHGGEVEWAISRKYQIPISDIISFASTVSPIIPESVKKLSERFDQLYLYPAREAETLKDVLVKREGLDASDRLILGCGSTELIYLFSQVVCNGEVIVPVPTYSEYESAIRRYGGTPVFVDLGPSFDIDIAKIKRSLTSRTKAVFVCNPNNPTGHLYSRKDLQDLAALAREKEIVLFVDEDYLCFAPEAKKFSMTEYVDSYPVFVVNSLSKLFGVPSIRLGWGAGSVSLIQKLSAFKLPWVISNLAVWAGEELLKDEMYQQRVGDLISRQRTGLLARLREVDWLQVFPSDANFILSKIIVNNLTSTHVFEKLVENRLVIRDCSSIRGLGNKYLRTTVRTADDNQLLISGLKEILAEHLALQP